MKLLVLVLFLAFLSGAASAAVPQWVQPGTSATYHMISGGWAGGAPTANNAAETYITNQANEVTADGTTGTASVYNPLTGQTDVQQVTCTDGGPACLGRFWLDPNDPAGSFLDETGVTYTVMNEMAYSAAGRNWDATMMAYQNPGSGVTYSVIYDARSGLVLSYSHEYPSEKIYLTLQSTNAVV